MSEDTGKETDTYNIHPTSKSHKVETQTVVKPFDIERREDIRRKEQHGRELCPVHPKEEGVDGGG